MRQREMKKKRRGGSGLAALILCGTLALSTSACALLPKEQEFHQTPTVSDYQPAAFVTAACVKADVETTIRVSVNYVPIQVAELCFGVAGKNYDEIYVKVGDIVKAGDLLAELDMGDLESKIADMGLTIDKYRLQLKQSEEERGIALQKADVQSRNLSEEDRNKALAKVRETYDQAKQSLEDKIYIAELRLADYEAQKAARQLVAPFDGTVTYTFPYTAADVSDITKPVVTVADSSMSLFRGKTPDWEAFKSGIEAVVETGNSTYEAWVRTEEDLGIAPTPHEKNDRGLVYLVLKETAFDLKDNASGTASLVLDSRQNVLSVPVKAVSTINGEPVVYISDENGLKSYRKVELGLIGDSRVEILSGLEEGERVVIN